MAADLPARGDDALRAGVAVTDITPKKPVTLAGYGSRKDLSQGVHDPLSARAVAFEQGGKRLVLLSTDLIGFYKGTAEVVRKAILSECRLQPSELFLCGIHTHSAPTPALAGSEAHPNNIEYTEWLTRRLVEVVREALGRATPVRIGFGSGSSPVGINRRQPFLDKDGKPQIKLGRNPNAMTDREVQVLKIARADKGELAAVLFAYATHSTSLGPKNYIVSGDVHGLAEQFVEKHLGGGVVTPAFAGASGDIDPWCRVLPEFKTANGWIPEPVLLGTLLGEEVVDVANAIQKLDANGPVRSAMKVVDLPRKTLDEAQTKAASILSAFHLTVGRVGDVAFVGLGGEVFNEIGRAIKTASPFPHTVIITHCNGAGGYVPTKQSYDDGGYEVKTSPYLPAAAEQLVQEAVRLLRGL
ncbi:MAG: neutral/alkaline non-lysosomal ceramidase N-terminal domain-containing protein [Verrucomicrobia bacterium]|nr:neutral/alkaline non-lysosomal ceramidase N-terminal domain-containing protein [Verrucomicrobiota bacterium]